MVISVFFVLAATFLSCITPVHAEEESDKDLLELYYEPSDLTVSAVTRSPRPLSRSAENITVITADEIKAQNAHSLTEVLNRVPGVQIDPRSAFGLFQSFLIQGADNRQILVLVDGVSYGTLSEGFAPISQIPVQNIERVEIVKGPVSSAWGSAMGGVVSVITKSPRNTAIPHGAASFSLGENGTRDIQGELTGTVGRLGYYLSGGNLTSNGFLPQRATDTNNFYSKLLWSLQDRGSLRFTLNYLDGSAGDGVYQNFGYSKDISNRQLISTLSLNYVLTDRLTLDLTAKTSRLDSGTQRNFLANGLPYKTTAIDEKNIGTSALLTWRQGLHTVVGGVEFDHGSVDTTVAIPIKRLTAISKGFNDKWGILLNDTIAWERFTLTPAIRFDRTNRDGDFWSPSLGATYNITDRTLVRVNAAKGYSLPLINPAAPPNSQKIWTLQAGIETTEIPFLWLKGGWFRNSCSDVLTTDSAGNPLLQNQLKEGFEVEARTAPLFNTWLTAGYTFIDSTDTATHEQIKGIPRQTWDLGVHYDDKEIFRGALLGHYIWWNTNTGNARYDDFIWDLNLGWKVYSGNNAEAEIFATGHNLFNGKQYSNELFVNPSRWFEGGLRIKW